MSEKIWISDNRKIGVSVVLAMDSDMIVAKKTCFRFKIGFNVV